MNTATYTVVGMSCGGCARKITEAVGQVAGVNDVSVDVATGAVTVRGDAAGDEPAVRAAVEGVGYEMAAT